GTGRHVIRERPRPPEKHAPGLRRERPAEPADRRERAVRDPFASTRRGRLAHVRPSRATCPVRTAAARTEVAAAAQTAQPRPSTRSPVDTSAYRRPRVTWLSSRE